MSDKTKQDKELEAESSAYCVASWLYGEDGIDTGDYSFGYLASWSQGKEIKELTECVENIKRASGILIDRLDQELGLERKPEEIRRENLTKETGQIVADAGIKAENVVIVAEQPGRIGRMVYVTNTDESYQGVFFLHGETEQIEHLLTDKEAVIEDYPSFFEKNYVGCIIIPYSKGQTFDYWYNYETKELRKYPIAAEREVTAMVTVTGRSTEEQVMQLNDAAPLIVGNRVTFVGFDTDVPEGFIESADEVTTRFEHYDSSWPMVQIRYTNVSDRIPGEMNIYEFQKMIEKQPDKVLNDPSKYFKVCISYTYLDQNHQTVQDVDLGRGRVDYLNYLKLSGSHIAHLKRHVDLLKVCDAAKHLAPGTEYGMQYEDNVQEWAGYCRETLNHFSDKPMIPRPPEIKSNEPIVSKDWRLAL